MDGEYDKKEDFSNVRKTVEDWFEKLQHERKCNSVNTVSKIVNHSTPEAQEYVRQLIADKINFIVNNSIKSKDLNEMLSVCNTINGCFDNFTHASDAVGRSYRVILPFAHCAIDEWSLESANDKPLIVILELLHCLSRILILILKQIKNVCQDHKQVTMEDQQMVVTHKNELSDWLSLKEKLNVILKRDDILIDTKNNFAICIFLIMEMIHSQEELKKYHNEFLQSIPSGVLDPNESKQHHLLFLKGSAIINAGSNDLVDKEAAFVYLGFFIALCEKYSSETPVILNASRTLLLLIKHKCFKDFLSNGDPLKIEKIKKCLLSCIFMLLEHPVACVRHSAKEFLLLLISHSSLQADVVSFAFQLPRDKRSYFVSVAAMASKMGSRGLVERKSDLPQQLLGSVYDPTMVSHVSFALENMMLNDVLTESDFSGWCELWIVPLLISLISVPPIVAAELEKLLEKAFKKYPNVMLFVTEKWKHPATAEELRCVITALKISHKQGFRIKCLSTPENDSGPEAGLNGTEKKWKKLIGEKLLEHCLHHGDDEIRISAFSLLVEARKSTEPYSEVDFRLIKYFLKYNLNNHQPATRQKIISLMRKMLTRFSDSRAAINRESKFPEGKELKLTSYQGFLNSLMEFCFANIFTGCNFNRLNTVLNILLICFECVRDMSFKIERTDYYWKKFLIALDSSYEENKQLTVVLSKKLDYNHLEAANIVNTKKLLNKAFCLIAHMEPPDVLTGSYLLQILINFPSTKEVLREFIEESDSVDIHYQCIRRLAEKLKEQIILAKLDLMTAATCGPMYGTLFAIRLLLKDVDFKGRINCIENVLDKSSLAKWSRVLNDLVEICFDMIPAVACVVNSSSPEGHLPMDFQTNFDNLRIDIAEGTNQEQKTILAVALENFRRKCVRIETELKLFDYDLYETLRCLKCYIKEGKLLIEHLEGFGDENGAREVEAKMAELEKTLIYLDREKKAVDWPATAQVLLLCAWRSVKEASLYLGDFVSKLPVETGIEIGFLSEPLISRIGEQLKLLLCEIKHRGSFEHVYIGFTQFVNSLWKCSQSHLNNLPRQWLEDVTAHLELPRKDQTIKLCSTRRSAGLPFLIQAVICSEIVSVKSSTPSSLHSIMKSLLKITKSGIPENPDSIIHALNILRALFKHAQLGEHVTSYIARAVMVAIRGSRAPTWSVRNSSNLLFSSLMIRIFGVARSKDDISKKNRMTSQTFFQRYSELYEFLLYEMNLAQPSGNGYPKPSLYLILLILGRLYPTPREDAKILDLSEFLPFVNRSRRNPIMKIRELGARALVPLIPAERLTEELDDRFRMIGNGNDLTHNEIHGILLQIQALLREYVEIVKDTNQTEKIKGEWIRNTKWLLRDRCEKKRRVSCVLTSSYLKICQFFLRHFPEESNKLVFKDTHVDATIPEDFIKNIKTEIGVYTALENELGLSLAIKCLSTSTQPEKQRLLETIRKSIVHPVDDVRLVSLRILCFIGGDDVSTKSDDSDFSCVGATPNELIRKEDVADLRSLAFNDVETFKIFLTALAKFDEDFFKSILTLRFWLKAFAGFFAEIRDFGHLLPGSSEMSDLLTSLKSLMKHKDTETSSHAFIIYSVIILRNYERYRTCKNDLAETMKMFSSPDADVRLKMAFAKILMYCFHELIDLNLIGVFNLWMTPIKLLLDECPTVRLVASHFVNRMQVHLSKNKLRLDFPVRMELLAWPTCHLIALKAQEFLLDAYLIVTPPDNYQSLLVGMLTVALSSHDDFTPSKSYPTDEFGVFEKGNPNPYYEEDAVRSLMFEKFAEWRPIINQSKSIDSELKAFINSDNYSGVSSVDPVGLTKWLN